MQRLRILGLALMVVFTLSVVASAAASAAVVVLPEGKELKWTGESGKGTIEALGGSKLMCNKGIAEGTIEGSKPLGLYHLHLLECESIIGGSRASCSSLDHKNSEKTILILGTYHLVFDRLEAKLAEAGIGMLFLVEKLHLLCESLVANLVTIKGDLLCLIKPGNSLVKHFEIVCEQSKGDSQEVVFWNEEGKEEKLKEAFLLALDDEKFEGFAILTTDLILTEKEAELMT